MRPGASNKEHWAPLPGAVVGLGHVSEEDLVVATVSE